MKNTNINSVKQGGISFFTFRSKPIRMRNWLLLPVKTYTFEQNISRGSGFLIILIGFKLK